MVAANWINAAIVKETLSILCACLPTPTHPLKKYIISIHSLTSNRTEIASTLEHTIVQYRHIDIVSANERSFLRGSICFRADRCLKSVLRGVCGPEKHFYLNGMSDNTSKFASRVHFLFISNSLSVCVQSHLVLVRCS